MFRGRRFRRFWFRFKILMRFYGLIGFTDLILLGLILGTADKLIDWTQVTSIFVAEIPIGGVLWILLERRDRQRQLVLDSVEMAKAMGKFGHLVIMRSDRWDAADPRDLDAYVVNLDTHKGYLVPPYIRNLVRGGIIAEEKRFKKREELTARLSELGVTIEQRFPYWKELDEGAP